MSESSSHNLYRDVLSSVVSLMCTEHGFTSAETGVIETLTEMLQSYLVEVGRSSRAYCELSGRSMPIVNDVIIALIDMGLNINSIQDYAKKSGRAVLLPLAKVPKPVPPKTLQPGERKPHPSYISEQFPSFPSAHCYIRTPTHKQPVTDYEQIREKAASQKRDLDRALSRFIAKTGATQVLFNDDSSMFPLVASKPTPNPYIEALLPKDQVFSEGEEDSKSKPKAGRSNQPEPEDQSYPKPQDSSEIDNPYLRQVKLCKKRKRT